jgi:hypothetical protein
MSARRSIPQRMLIAANLTGVLTDAEHFIRERQEINELEALAETQSRLRAWTEDAVTEARSAGHSWATIGTALSITKQAAQQRYGNTRKWTKADTEAGMPGQHALI